MDNLAHSLVGLTAAKAGLDKLSPYATSVCVVSANIADADFITLFFGDRWTLLQYHRGITHSIVGTIAIGLIVPTFVFLFERIVTRMRGRPPKIRFAGLLLASMIAAATHPFMDWTNNYGVRPLLPWSGRWFYGDLVFIADPYIWLGLGAVAFLLTSDKRWKLIGWSFIAAIATLVLIGASRQTDPEAFAVRIALAIWTIGIIVAVSLRRLGPKPLLGSRAAMIALASLVLYWTGLAFAHGRASAQTASLAASIAHEHHESLIKTATMPTEASPFRWQSVVESDVAFYKFAVIVGSDKSSLDDVTKFEKPTGKTEQLVSSAEQDRRAQALLGFARFPLARVNTDNCIGQVLVQMADLRYTEPGRGRGNFSVNIPVDCPLP
ncbi:MAG TPA: metal-dependent hydrolase [Pyrinomonadaceae bacterium]|jgi:inner membrane protein|nr:metal-dependent hydrolase [Pyrinomonadaceae bacterium]